MSARKSGRPKISFRNVPEDGQVLAHLYRISSGPVQQPCTAEITDYPPATETMIELNESFLSGRGVCQDLKKSPHWREEQGVVVLERENYVPKHQSVARLQDEFWERFNDCTFTLKGTSQYCNERTLKGGWLVQYANTLTIDEGEQQRSILVVPKPELAPFRKICPETAALVDSVQRMLYQLVPKYKYGRLQHGGGAAVSSRMVVRALGVMFARDAGLVSLVKETCSSSTSPSGDTRAAWRWPALVTGPPRYTSTSAGAWAGTYCVWGAVGEWGAAGSYIVKVLFARGLGGRRPTAGPVSCGRRSEERRHGLDECGWDAAERGLAGVDAADGALHVAVQLGGDERHA